MSMNKINSPRIEFTSLFQKQHKAYPRKIKYAFIEMLADNLAPNKALIIGEILLFSVIIVYWRLFSGKDEA